MSSTPSSTPATVQDFSGVYTLTIKVPTRCNPADFTPVPDRRYSAVLTQTGESASVKLSGADFIVSGSPPRGDGFAGKGGQSGFDFVLDGAYDENAVLFYPDVAERLPDGRVIVISGDVVALPAPSGLSGSIYGGTIAFYPSGTRFPSSAAPTGYCWDLLVGFDLTR